MPPERVTANWLSAPTPDGVIDAEVTDASPDDAKVSVYDEVVRPANVRLAKVEEPDTAATPDEAWAPPNVPPDAVTVTVAVDVVAFPYASTTITTGCVDSAAPDAAGTGCVPTVNLLAVSATTVTVRRSETDDEIESSVTDTVVDAAL